MYKENLIDFIKEFEGFGAIPYLCPAGKWTIGYGHVILPEESFPRKKSITEATACQILLSDLRWAEKAVSKWVHAPLSDNQRVALVSFTFNVGEPNLAKSTLIKKLNLLDYQGAGLEFLKWDKTGKPPKPVAGLTRRRCAESKLFLRGDDVL